ncbi:MULTISPECIES: acetyl-CoA carboxylase biotin carboxyl carrier protein [Bacillota]|jgi:acetyl-CoA carboxylase biotin carboxyl carrier protein|uniref:Biotin carboxyl carrier protein of acetyl-CoA carboxylase n=2 Tax=Amedibacillus TaxID=2749846 RepID=A0A7G9GK62_9FIRM|nr:MULTISPECIES: biotin/lipoyl-containing protein [Bacillota]QNM11194.1 acetyl-CoA carboxylase, biotin carboxyl carrier protein [[Eubacterium] hominis]MCH4284754.1 acetyl-CoA carboxylase, biotin carboxyl carrier protein [Amedibacillus hominis]RGB52589.1 acetyl-CoA carboxylase, biotin carboxyl carrier protein [Absiella sp. AM22-9]RGB57062.1 acetyl-CoA carboxylase, biotin carboxyl carrier protein [Absiella sp. AM10-20]RGB68087.1 acetyl-CoA carboxylase, biotin carboxyl carrier protein [Absiella s
MNTKEIQELIAVFENSNLSRMEIEASDIKLKMEKPVGDVQIVSTPVSQPKTIEVNEEKTETKKEGYWVKAPIVGTFYQSRAKGSTPFVEIGQQVKKGDVLCIIEAMKVMNEIHAPMDGVIAEILVTDDSMVEFDQELMRIVEGVK